jgi:hypothetical protein
MIICRVCGHQNPNGTAFCQNAACGTFLEWSGESVDTGILPKVEAEPAGKPEPSRKRVRFVAFLVDPEARAEPGGEGRVKANIVNKGDIVDRFRVEIFGQAAPWASVDRPDVSLFPEAEDGAEVVFRPPRSSAVTAGHKRFQLRISSTEDPEVSTVLDGIVEVGAFYELSANFVPRNSEGRRESRVNVTLVNEGNAPVDVRLTANDPDAALTFAISPAEVNVPPGEEATAEIQFTAKRSLPVGPAKTHRFEVYAEADSVPEVRMDGSFVQTAPAARKITRTHVVAFRAALTLIGALIMIRGAFAPWVNGDRGLDVSYDQYADAAFGANVTPPPGELATLASVAMPAIFLAGVALLGIFGKGRLTRFAALLAVLLYVAFAVTLIQGGAEVGIGVWAVIVGGVIAFIGGLLGYVKRSPNSE